MSQVNWQFCCYRRQLLAVGLITLLLHGVSIAAPAVQFNQSLGGTGLNRDQSVGWAFNVLESVTVTHLAWFDQDQNGLSTIHDVALWDPSGVILAQATIPAGVSAELDGIWRVVGISPISLNPGNGYIIGGTNFAISTDRLAAGIFPIEVDPRLEHVETRFSTLGTGLRLPNMTSAAQVGFYGPGFNVVPIPEPQTIVILLFGAALLGRRRNMPIR